MIAYIQKRMQERENEGGFTLVELLVVIIIIGILAAIAIPLYMNQQAKAQDSAAKSDLANARIEVASMLVENPSAGSVSITGFAGSENVSFATTTITITDGEFCIAATAPGGDKKNFSTDETGKLYEESTTCS